MNASEKFLSQGDDDSGRASQVFEKECMITLGTDPGLTSTPPIFACIAGEIEGGCNPKRQFYSAQGAWDGEGKWEETG